jgi:hypothetical protein
MLSEYEAAVLTRLGASGNGYRPNRIVTRNNRIGVAFLVLSLVSASGLLHSTVFSRAEYKRANQATSVGNADDSGKNLCSMRDARFLLQLDQHGEQGDVPGEKLYAAYLTMLRARTACSAGRPEEALQLYDSAFGPVQAPE